MEKLIIQKNFGNVLNYYYHFKQNYNFFNYKLKFSNKYRICQNLRKLK